MKKGEEPFAGSFPLVFLLPADISAKQHPAEQLTCFPAVRLRFHLDALSARAPSSRALGAVLLFPDRPVFSSDRHSWVPPS